MTTTSCGNFVRTLPREAKKFASRWVASASDPVLVDLFEQLRTAQWVRQRSGLTHELRNHLAQEDRYQGGW